MTPASTSHPSLLDLAALRFGRLDPAVAAQLEQHLTACSACHATLQQVPVETLQALLASSAQGTIVGHAPATPAPARALPAAPIPPSQVNLPPTDPGTMQPVPSNIPPELASHPNYRNLRLLGRGGMGAVYQAEDTFLGRPVAIKLINRALLDQPATEERFRAEMQAAARLNHPNIVHAYSAERRGVLTLFVMEYVRGEDLHSKVRSTGPLSTALACWCIHQAAQGLQHAHEKGMVHRDIKPSNIMLTPPEKLSPGQPAKKPELKILDFGLAKAVSEQQRTRPGLTAAGAMMGTPEFMAPEQARDAAAADIRADIYSLGCTLHFLLTGRPPFPMPANNDLLGVLMAHQSESPPRLDALKPDLPAELADLTAHMLAKNPTDRPQTPAEVAKAIGPIHARLISGQKAAPIAAPVVPAVKPLANGSKSPSPIPMAAPIAAPHEAPWQFDIEPAKAVTAPKQSFPLKYLMFVAGGLAAAAGLLVALIAISWASGAFASKDGTLALSVSEPDSEVIIDGKKTPVTWHAGAKSADLGLTAGEHLVKISKKGYISAEEKVTIPAGGRKPMTVALEREPTAVAAGPSKDPAIGGTDAKAPDPGPDKSSASPMPGASAGPATPPTAGNSPKPADTGSVAPPRPPIEPKTPDGFTRLFNGIDLTGWRTHASQPDAWRVVNGALVSPGPSVRVSHLYSDRSFVNPLVRIRARINGIGDGGLLIRSTFGPYLPLGKATFPRGYTAKINVQGGGDYRTGSLLAGTTSLYRVGKNLVEADQWFTLEVLAFGNQLAVLIDGKEAASATDRTAVVGRIALQQADDKTIIEFQSVEAKELTSRPPQLVPPPTTAGAGDAFVKDSSWNGPLTGSKAPAGVTIQVALTISERTGEHFKGNLHVVATKGTRQELATNDITGTIMNGEVNWRPIRIDGGAAYSFIGRVTGKTLDGILRVSPGINKPAHDQGQLKMTTK